jgi:uncharacterized phage protein (TIGR01671 family)
MREIKFRGYAVDYGWVYGYFYHDQVNIGGDMCQDVWIIKDECDQEFRVLEETVGQYTGLHDKNGKEMYDGDIVKHDSLPNAKSGYPLKFGECRWYIEAKMYTDNVWLSNYSGRHSEVVGNIYNR